MANLKKSSPLRLSLPLFGDANMNYRFKKEEKIDIVVEGMVLEFSKQILCNESPIINATIVKDRRTGGIEIKGKKDDVEMMLCFLSPRVSAVENEPVIDARRMLPLAYEYKIDRLLKKCEDDLMEEENKHLEHVYLASKYDLLKLLVIAINACGEKKKWNLIFESGPLFELVGLDRDKYMIEATGEEERCCGTTGKFYTEKDLTTARTAVKLTERNVENLELFDHSFFRLMDNYYRYQNLRDKVTYYDGEKIMIDVEKWIDASILCKIFSAQLDKLDEAVE